MLGVSPNVKIAEEHLTVNNILSQCCDLLHAGLTDTIGWTY